jgi:hypothetical protein
MNYLFFGHQSDGVTSTMCVVAREVEETEARVSSTRGTVALFNAHLRDRSALPYDERTLCLRVKRRRISIKLLLKKARFKSALLLAPLVFQEILFCL